MHKSIRVTIRHLPFTINPALPWAHKVLAAQHLTVSSQSLQAWEGAGLSRLWLWLPEVSVLSKELKEPRRLVASLKPSAFDILLLSPERRERWNSPAHMPHGPRAPQSTLSVTIWAPTMFQALFHAVRKLGIEKQLKQILKT